MYLGYWIYNVYLTTYGQTIGLSHYQASLLVSVFGIVNTIGRVILGYVADHVNVLYLYASSIFLKGVFTIFMTYITNGGWFFAFTIAAALGSAGGLLLGNVTAKYFPIGDLPGIMGIIYSVAGIGSLSGAPLVGYIIKIDSYKYATLFGGMVMIVASLIMIWIPLVHNHQEKRKVVINESRPLLENTEVTNTVKD